ncbi:hypothetical protein C5748_19335 [Phyllobacterium phragmitis]|uniref:Uncharacterized protein n=1 Tax=Phyllobacterium phragmitis TaxID=2670329 RepID=A0A2S9IMP9_9HYPH|nr:hypothetical protein [Phyllobacterium phragmitis]PRD41813.1 hypothetical protein C5748_19335 [Phyllobacterium phragmitis]
MRKKLPISTAPMNGTKIIVLWTDDDERENETVARYHSLAQLKAGGGDWDEADTGWWIFTDSRTQKKIDPAAWISGNDDENENGDDT